MKAFAEGDNATAAAELTLAIEQHADAETAIYLGNAYLKLGKLGAARDAFARALELETKSSRRAGIQRLIRNIEKQNVGVVKVVSVPPGAAVKLAAKQDDTLGKTPVKLSLVPGPQRLVVRLDGYEDVKVDVQVDRSQPTTIELTLRKLACDLAIASATAGSRASVDGAAAFPLPAKIKLGRGAHRVVVSAEGFESQESSVRCPSSTPLRIDAQLVRGKSYGLRTESRRPF